VGLFWDLPKIVSWWENLVLVVLVLGSLGAYRRLLVQAKGATTQEGRPCRPCGVRVEGRDHHCVWLGLCVSSANHRTFLLLLLLLLLSSLHLSLLLTSAACPGEVLGPVLLPKACWPYSPTKCLLLVGGLYSGVVAVCISLLLVAQLLQWRRRSRGGLVVAKEEKD